MATRPPVTARRPRRRVNESLVLGCLGALLLFSCILATTVWAGVRLLDGSPEELIGWLATPPGARENSGRLGEPTQVPTTSPPTPTLAPTPTPTLPPPPTAAPLPPPTPSFAFPDAPNLDQRYISPAARADLSLLMETIFPARDYYEIEARLGGRKLRGRTVNFQPHQIGERRLFFSGGEAVPARLVVRSEQAYWWVDDRLDLPPGALQAVGDQFDRVIYPRVTALFGREPEAGIDGELPIHIVHLADIDTEELGYFDSSDQYPVEIFSESNQLDGFYLNMGELQVGEKLYYGTIVHELQHLLHWLNDPNETTWLDEGLAQVAEVATGFDTFTVEDYLDRPNVQLNRWSTDGDEIYGHYAASALFAIYFWEQLGDEGVRALVRHPADGLPSVAAVLREFRPESSLEQFLGEWYAATYLRGEAPGRYGYGYNFPRLRPDLIRRDPGSEVGELQPLGVRYVELDQQGTLLLSFAGETLVDLIDAPAHSGEKVWLAPPINGMAASLSRFFDLRGVDSATLTFWTWYDLERDFDFAYVTVSTNGGQTWTVLPPRRGFNSPFGYGFNGRSREIPGHVNGWVQEVISLDRFAGQEILLRFEVLTDAVVASRGIALDDIAIPEIGYQHDVELEAGGWTAAGFVRTGTVLPQQWSLQLVTQEKEPRIVPLTLSDFNQGQWRLELQRPVTLIIAPITPFTNEGARYWFKIEQLP